MPATLGSAAPADSQACCTLAPALSHRDTRCDPGVSMASGPPADGTDRHIRGRHIRDPTGLGAPPPPFPEQLSLSSSSTSSSKKPSLSADAPLPLPQAGSYSDTRSQGQAALLRAARCCPTEGKQGLPIDSAWLGAPCRAHRPPAHCSLRALCFLHLDVWRLKINVHLSARDLREPPAWSAPQVYDSASCTLYPVGGTHTSASKLPVGGPAREELPSHLPQGSDGDKL